SRLYIDALPLTFDVTTLRLLFQFIRTRNKGPSMWVYGITLFLTESTKEAKPSAFDYDIIQTFFSNAGRDKMSQVSEMARMFGLYGERETARNCSEKPLETREACTNEIERVSSEKELAHRGDNCEQSNATECKNGVARRDSGTERLSCARNSKRSDADLVSRLFCRRRPKIPNPRFDDIKEDLMKAFGGEDEMCLCDNNRFLSEKYLQRKSGAPTSDSDPFKCRNKNGDDARDYRSREVENSQCRKRPINRVSAEELTNREDYKKFRSYIANKLCDMEGRLMKRIDEMEAGTNRKLNAILERLETLN
ncbi:PREDICTED: uncharacterized protein LOC105566417, partial [Vollenhovia emeryi]|uniref:uncharacterized protein LOC105566417 n=1 Tax=Vollenhovia emeryi TaxID=411798 RepID=UPI0005F589F3